MPNDRERVRRLEQTWDELVRPSGPVSPRPTTNPYVASYEEEGPSRDDQNLLTAFGLLCSRGFEDVVGRFMAEQAERHLPHTLSRLHTARERARAAGTGPSSELKEQFRGMTAMAYAWGYVMAVTQRLSVRDQGIWQGVLELAESQPDTLARRRLTSAAENRLESTLGTLLQAIANAQKQRQRGLELFYQGALMMLYALCSLHFGTATTYLP